MCMDRFLFFMNSIRLLKERSKTAFVTIPLFVPATYSLFCNYSWFFFAKLIVDFSKYVCFVETRCSTKRLTPKITMYWTILGTELPPCFILRSQVVLMKFHPVNILPNVIQNHGTGVKI